MRSAKAIRKEHKDVCAKIAELMREGDEAGCPGPVPEHEELYFRLYSIQITLEWVHPNLIKTVKCDVPRHMQLIGHKHYTMGPLFRTLYP